MLTWETIVTNVNWTFVINLVQFFVLIAVLNRMVYRPLTAFMDKREARLEAQLHKAEQQRTQAQALKEKREGELHQASQQAQQTLASARSEAADLRQQLRVKSEQEAQQIVAEARRQAAAQLAPVRTELERQTPRLGAVMAEQVLGHALGGS